MRKFSYFGLLFCLTSVFLTGCLRSASGDPLASPNPRALSTPTIEPTPYIPPTAQVIEVIVTATEDPILLTQQALNQAALAQQVVEPSLDPLAQDQGIVAQQPTSSVTDPLLLTATGIVAQATQQSIDKTATALGPVIELPTFTPTIDPFLIPTPTLTPQSGVVFGQDCVHEVSTGENLYRISLRYGVLVNDIARSSGVSNIELIIPGQKLVIPGCGTTGSVPPPTSQPTPLPNVVNNTTDTQFGTGGQIVSTPFASAGGVQHTVQQGETLFELSLRYGVPVNTIASANGITNVDMIKMNQVLTIP